MNADHDKQDELQRMLALKRHEAPPPRFFKGFSHQVIDRLHSPEPAVPPSFWQRLRADLESKPVLVCGSGVIVCGLLVVGLIASLRVQPPKPAPRQAGDEALWTVSPSAAALAAPAMTPTIPVEPLRIGDPVLISEPSPFIQRKPGNSLPSSQVPLQ
jgi:hypothetical protein